MVSSSFLYQDKHGVFITVVECSGVQSRITLPQRVQVAAAQRTPQIPCSLYDFTKDTHHICSLSGKPFNFKMSRELMGDLRIMRSRVVDSSSCVGFPSANIMGTTFNAGEWPNYPRCGSVITCLMGKHEPGGPRSLFARVLRFFKVIDDDNAGYASVAWFSEPEYLYTDNPLGSRCREDGAVLGRQYGNVVRITQIDPTDIMVEYESDSDTYIMIRDKGYSTRRT